MKFRIAATALAALGFAFSSVARADHPTRIEGLVYELKRQSAEVYNEARYHFRYSRDLNQNAYSLYSKAAHLYETVHFNRGSLQHIRADVEALHVALHRVIDDVDALQGVRHVGVGYRRGLDVQVGFRGYEFRRLNNLITEAERTVGYLEGEIDDLAGPPVSIQPPVGIRPPVTIKPQPVLPQESCAPVQPRPQPRPLTPRAPVSRPLDQVSFSWRF